MTVLGLVHSFSFFMSMSMLIVFHTPFYTYAKQEAMIYFVSIILDLLYSVSSPCSRPPKVIAFTVSFNFSLRMKERRNKAELRHRPAHDFMLLNLLRGNSKLALPPQGLNPPIGRSSPPNFVLASTSASAPTTPNNFTLSPTVGRPATWPKYGFRLFIKRARSPYRRH